MISAGCQPKTSLKLGLMSTNRPLSSSDTEIGTGLLWNRVENFSSEARSRCSYSTLLVMSLRMPVMRKGVPWASRYSRAVLSRWRISPLGVRAR